MVQTGMQGERTIFQNGSNDPVSFGRVAKLTLDAEANELYVADGYLNKRVVVLDPETGAFKRFWGAYGNVPDDEAGRNLGRYSPGETPPREFRGPVHCAEPANDDRVYVCDRAADRIQVFQKDGTFVNEVIISPATLSQGSTWDIAFSPDEAQTYLKRGSSDALFDRRFEPNGECYTKHLQAALRLAAFHTSTDVAQW